MDMQIQIRDERKKATPGSKVDPDEIIVSTEQFYDIVARVATTRVLTSQAAIKMRMGDDYEGVLKGARALLDFEGSPSEVQLHLNQPHEINGYRVRIQEVNPAGMPVANILNHASVSGHILGILNACNATVEPFQREQPTGAWLVLWVQPWTRKHINARSVDSGTGVIARDLDKVAFCFNSDIKDGKSDDLTRSHAALDRLDAAPVVQQAVDVVGYTVVIVDASGNKDLAYEKGVMTNNEVQRGRRQSAVPVAPERPVADVVKDFMMELADAQVKAKAEAAARAKADAEVEAALKAGTQKS